MTLMPTWASCQRPKKQHAQNSHTRQTQWCLHVQGRVTGVMGVPVVPHNPGDCFMWGQAAASSGIPGTLLARNKAPVLVPNTTHLDICEVRGPFWGSGFGV